MLHTSVCTATRAQRLIENIPWKVQKEAIQKRKQLFWWKSGTILHLSLNLYIHLNRDGLTMDLTGLAKFLWRKVIKEAQQGHHGKVEERNVQGCAHKGSV